MPAPMQFCQEGWKKSSSGGFRSLTNSAVSPYNGYLLWTRHGAHHMKPLSMYTQILKASDDPAAPGPAAILQHGLFGGLIPEEWLEKSCMSCSIVVEGYFV